MRFLFPSSSLTIIDSSPHKISTPVHVHRTSFSVGASSKTSVISYMFSTPHRTSPETTSKMVNFILPSSSPSMEGNLFNACFSTINACFASNVFLLAKSISSSSSSSFFFSSSFSSAPPSPLIFSPFFVFFIIISFSRSSFHFCIVATFRIPSTRSKQSNPPLHKTSKLAETSNIGARAQSNLWCIPCNASAAVRNCSTCSSNALHAFSATSVAFAFFGAQAINACARMRRCFSAFK